MADWISFWNGENAIYVNERHRQVHYARIAADLARFVPGPRARVLDFGCGDALGAEAMARRCGLLVLSDAAPAVRARLAERFARVPNICVRSPEEVEALPPESFDLIVCNSVAQYLTREALSALLCRWRVQLAPGGSILVADVIPPHVSAVVDAGALLGLAIREKFLPAALTGLARMYFSPYRRLRGELGLTTYEESEMRALLEGAGFVARRVQPNVGHNQQRMAFQAFRP
ncbi:class I SAM-dependent methyltransferase [Xanthobacter dioxanivorans]|uniref:Class I SAM-dependent methyltransferase n=1 Tax=Xanthobacter dioxanivorans TaxID=2528964 RepID=A0A974PJS4_9HYPH|nr:methyltransferase domain-containing protein [Xanthobacter dioxanivorans]QRG04489.1 class I SAM-dependent methyltransferase [Xanthobacter dioxanivorans]